MKAFCFCTLHRVRFYLSSGTIRTNMKVSATMSAQNETPKKKSTQVSTTVSPEKFAALEDYRWENRVNKMSDVIAEAVDVFIQSKGIKVAGAEAAPEKPAKA